MRERQTEREREREREREEGGGAGRGINKGVERFQFPSPLHPASISRSVMRRRWCKESGKWRENLTPILLNGIGFALSSAVGRCFT